MVKKGAAKTHKRLQSFGICGKFSIKFVSRDLFEYGGDGLRGYLQHRRGNIVGL